MANITEFTRIMKLPKFTLMSIYSGCIQSKSSASNMIRKCLYHIQILPDHPNKHSSRNISKTNIFERHLSLDTKKDGKSYNSTNYQGNGTRAISLDNFGIRQEIKEENEHSKEQEPPDAKYEQLEALRSKILEASLPFVNIYGWTRKAIAQGADSIGYPGIAHGIFPDGGIELIRHFYIKCNMELVDQLRKETRNGEILTEEPSEFLVKAVKTRLQMIEPHLTNWPQALAIMSLPQNVPSSLAQLLTLVDDICYYSGDRSVDFGWYTRRVGLATIYKITELYMLQDPSINHEETWNFLRKRMKEASNFEALVSHSDGLTQNVQQKLISAFETARNILGLDYNRK